MWLMVVARVPQNRSNVKRILLDTESKMGITGMSSYLLSSTNSTSPRANNSPVSVRRNRVSANAVMDVIRSGIGPSIRTTRGSAYPCGSSVRDRLVVYLSKLGEDLTWANVDVIESVVVIEK